MLKPLLDKVLKPGVSDLHLKAHEPPQVRILGNLLPVGTNSIRPEDIDAILTSIISDDQRKILNEKGDVALSQTLEGVGRLRINVYKQRGTYAIAIRIVPPEPKSFDTLHLPKETLEKLSQTSRGLVIISGVTGAGKTTTLNAIINYMNENYSYNIITLEDPIEFSHKRKKSSISQREIGKDVPTFAEGFKFTFRQDPDVIVIGEMTTMETFKGAIEGAASGHLVLATLHSSDTLDALDRIVNSFEYQQQPYIKMQLTNVIKAVVSQRLIADKSGKGCLPATEILFGTLQLRKLLSTGGIAEARFLMEKGSAYGMHTFDQDLMRMVDESLITPDEALDNATNPNDLRIKLQGQSGTETPK